MHYFIENSIRGDLEVASYHPLIITVGFIEFQNSLFYMVGLLKTNLSVLDNMSNHWIE